MTERSYGDPRSIPVHGRPGIKTREGETGTIRNWHCKSLLICHLICHCELLLWSNLKWWNVKNGGGYKMRLLPGKRRGLGVWEPLTLLMCKLFRLLRSSQWQITNDPKAGLFLTPCPEGHFVEGGGERWWVLASYSDH